MSSADTTTAEPAAEALAEPVDEARASLLAQFQAELGDQIVDHVVRPGDDLWIRVATPAWREAGLVARDKAGCTYFSFLSAIDWMPSPYGRYEDAEVDEPTLRAQPLTEVEHGLTGGDTRLQVFARVVSTTRHLGVTLKVDVPDDDPTVESWVNVYAGADWHERETWEMFGITFAGHPGLRHIYLPGDFEGHPLRKDYPLIARIVKPWPGIVDVEPMPGEPDEPNEGDEPAEGDGS